MKQALIIIQIVVSVILIGLILIQAKGTGFGRVGGTSFTRRGLEKLVFRLTFVIAFVFLTVSILQLVF